MKPVRVLVVEDSLTVRRYLLDALAQDPGLEVVGEAADGETALDLVEQLEPDVICLDMVLPGLDGLAVAGHIMAYRPTPILVVSAAENRGEAFRTYDALAAGAVDVLEKPTLADDPDVWRRQFLRTLRMVAKIKVVTHPRGRLGVRPAPAPPPRDVRPNDELALVAIGASTGGPGALSVILPALPRDYPLPIVVLLHIDVAFAPSFRDWLQTVCPFRVQWARDGAAVPETGTGVVLLAPPDAHLVVEGGRFRLDHGAERHACRPSVDVLFESLAKSMGSRVAGVLLTGMGRDGGEGLLRIRQAGGLTIAQDEATSVVYGMPREAALLGAAEHVLPLPEIAGALRRLVGRSSRRSS